MLYGEQVFEGLDSRAWVVDKDRLNIKESRKQEMERRMKRTMVEVPPELRKIIDVEEEVDTRLVTFAKKKERLMLAIIASYVPKKISPSEAEFAHLGISEEFGVETTLSQIFESTKKRLPLFLLLNSTGGTVFSSYKTAKAIRESFDDITVFVPHLALSGGTLIALAGNKIVMGTMSHLSPLDVQVAYKDTYVSANAFFRTHGRLEDYFKDKTVESAPYPYKAMADKLNGVVVEEIAGEQSTACKYVEEILKKSGYRNAKKLARKLMYDLPSHSLVINYDLAKKLGVKAMHSRDDQETWQMMRYWLAKYVLKATNKHFIRYIIP